MPQNIIAIKIAQSTVLAAASTVASGVSIAIQLSTPHEYLGLQIEYKYFLIASIVLCFVGALLDNSSSMLKQKNRLKQSSYSTFGCFFITKI